MPASSGKLGIDVGLMDSLSGLFSRGSGAMALYKHGIKKANAKDFAGAIDVYSRILKTFDAPGDVKAMAQFNRGLAYSSIDEFEKAVEDLQAVLDSRDTPSHMIAAAKQKLVRYQKLAERAAKRKE
jgi:tetratricopeptide (TPR) repeat protein